MAAKCPRPPVHGEPSISAGAAEIMALDAAGDSILTPGNLPNFLRNSLRKLGKKLPRE